jgi:hypothetical protein
MYECITVETHREEDEFGEAEGELDEREWYTTEERPDSSSSMEVMLGVLR